MSSYLQPGGPVTIGTSQGDQYSIESLENFKDSSGVNNQRAISQLRAYLYANAVGGSIPAGNSNVAFSDFRGAEIFAFVLSNIQSAGNSGSPYFTPFTNGVLAGNYYGGTGSFNFNLNGVGTQGGSANFTNLANGGYTLTVTDNTTGQTMNITVQIANSNNASDSYITYNGSKYSTGNYGQNIWKLPGI